MRSVSIGSRTGGDRREPRELAAADDAGLEVEAIEAQRRRSLASSSVSGSCARHRTRYAERLPGSTGGPSMQSSAARRTCAPA